MDNEKLAPWTLIYYLFESCPETRLLRSLKPTERLIQRAEQAGFLHLLQNLRTKLPFGGKSVPK